MYNVALKINKENPLKQRRPTCLILAAGQGSRLSGRGDSKPLIDVGGRPLLEWVFRAAQDAGLEDIFVVTGYKRAKIQSFAEQFSKRHGIDIHCLYNPLWEKENGLSVLKAKGHIRGEFFLLMADHLFDKNILFQLKSQPLAENELILAVDFDIQNNSNINYEDVTKVQVKDGRISAIGKDLATFNAFDTGIFLCTPALFEALEESLSRNDSSLTGGVRVMARKGNAKVMGMDGGWWIDVDDENAAQKAERIVTLSRQD